MKKEKTTIPPLDMQSLRILVREYYDCQEERQAMEGRLGIKKDGEAKKNTPERNEDMLITLYARHKELETLEIELGKVIAKEVHKYPLWKHFSKISRGSAKAWRLSL